MIHLKETVPATEVIVRFPQGIKSDDQGKALLQFERILRGMGYPAEVHKETMPDDSKLRRAMTPEQRERL